jgi:DNA segregation ATPase FtsK/SpoIIIE, S-DNA-T family
VQIVITVVWADREIRGSDVVLAVDPDTPIGTIPQAAADAEAAVAGPARGLSSGSPTAPLACYLAELQLEPAATVRECGLVTGDRLGLGAPVPPGDDASAPPNRLAWYEVHQVGGEGAGRIWPVGIGSHDIGSGPGRAIDPPGSGIPARGAVLSIDRHGRAQVCLEPGAQVRLSTPEGPVRPGLPLPHGYQPTPDTPWTAEPTIGPVVVPEPGTPQPWPIGTDLAIGTALLRLVPRFEPDAWVRPAEDIIGLDFNRPPRIVPPLMYAKRRYPSPPSEQGRAPIPILITLAPMVMGLAFYLLFDSLFFLIFMLFSPVLGLANWQSSKRSGRARYRKDFIAYHRDRDAMDAELRQAVDAERLARCAAVPDPALLGQTASGPGRRLWERRRSDADFLVLRMGTLDQASLMELEDSAQPEHLRHVRWSIPDVPIAVGLPERGVIGVAGDPREVSGLTRWLVAQSAVLHSPRDLRIVILTDAEGRERWEWTRWLPHVRPYHGFGGGGPFQTIGNDLETVAARVNELVTLVRARTKVKGTASGVIYAEPDVMVVLDGARRFRDVPGMVQVLKEGPAVRVFAVCIDSLERLLPEECTCVLRMDPDGLVARQSDAPEATGVRADGVDERWSERVARALAPLRDVTPDESGGLPAEARLLDLLNADPPDPAVIAASWERRPSSSTFPMGKGFEGVFNLDLVRDGPHGLVAGTTGAGKSELLQTLVVSIAAVNRPDEAVFVLVDYKGGSAFHSCVKLPHTLGMVTDLDSALVVRALDSLAAELRRREEMLAASGAKDLVEYRAMRGRDPQLPRIPRLILVIDEFATLVREVPEFIPGLVSIAQRGRSLGVHLILATQRPAGAVTADIRANTNLRIALRVTDPHESTDVIDVPDATAISVATPGRALARLAHGSVVGFQTGYVGGAFHDPTVDPKAAAEVRPAAAARAALLTWVGLGRPMPRLDDPQQELVGNPADPERTDLDVLVEAIAAAATTIGSEPQPSPWLPALPQLVVLDELLGRTGSDKIAGGGLPLIPYALEDVPSQQQQRVLVMDLATFGHLFILGTARSGRSSMLRTLAGAIAATCSVADVHLYGIDAASGSLAVLSELPHCGAVVPRVDLERMERLLSRLGTELVRRQELVAKHSAAGLAELRAALPRDERPPHIVVFVDGWDALAGLLTEHDSGRLYDGLLGLLRDGTGVGIHFVITSERALISGRAAAFSDNRVMLRMADRSDYSGIGVQPRVIPETVFPGRAWRSLNQAEIQIALLATDRSGQAQREALIRIGRTATNRDRDLPVALRPLPVSVLPSAITFVEAFEAVPQEQRRPLWGLLGLGGDGLAPIGVDFAEAGHTFLIAGPPGSGRSNVLSALAVSLLAGGTRLVVVTPRDSPLRRLSGHPDVLGLTGPAPDVDGLEEYLAEQPSVILVDDVELLGYTNPLDPVLQEVVATGRDRGIGLACAGNAETLSQALSGWLADARRSRHGVLLAPQSQLEGDLLGTRVPTHVLRGGVGPGRGYVADRKARGLSTVVIPHTVLR